MGVALTSKLKRLENVSLKFFRLFLNWIFSHEWCKAVTAMCVCGEFTWKLENNQLPDCSIILFYVRWKLWLTFREFVPSHWYLKLVSAEQNSVYLALKWQILAVMARIKSWYLLTFWDFSFNFEGEELCYFLQEEWRILSILFELIVQRQNEKFYSNFSYWPTKHWEKLRTS